MGWLDVSVSRQAFFPVLGNADTPVREVRDSLEAGDPFHPVSVLDESLRPCFRARTQGDFPR
jgi:hypothetical protein